uniref:NUDIX hydrolase n=1 Tax=Paenibacillus terrae TaxID=159743 RepID=UPI0011A16D80|nr:NUDIX domain-containing protein [Paenibacillus terrae]
MMISYETGTNTFQLRAACIILHRDKVLMQRAEHNQLWFIPGGRVEFGETAEETIEREMMEEYGAPIYDRKLLWIIENFIDFPDRKVHELGMFFLVNLPRDHSIYHHVEEFQGMEDGFVNRWIDIDELDQYTVIPEFVASEIRHLDHTTGVKHIKNRAVR